MTLVFLLLSVIANWIKYTYLFKWLIQKLKIKKLFYQLFLNYKREEEKEEETDSSTSLQLSQHKRKWLKLASKVIKQRETYFESLLKIGRTNRHRVFIPGATKSQFAELVLNITDLKERQAKFFDRVKKSQEKVEKKVKHFEEMSAEDRKKYLREIADKMKDRDNRMGNILSEYLERAGRKLKRDPNSSAAILGRKWLEKTRRNKEIRQRNLSKVANDSVIELPRDMVCLRTVEFIILVLSGARYCCNRSQYSKE